MVLALLCLLCSAAFASAYIETVSQSHGQNDFIHAFPLSSVQLDPESPAGRAQALNAEYLRMIDPDALLWAFRKNAGLPTGEAVPYYGSWEDPAVEVRGEFTGHYLSATALYYNHTGDEAVRVKGQYLVQELKKVQDAIGTGYLSAFPTEHFDRLQSLQPVWAPFYVIHKIMAGLLDQHQLAGNDLALGIALDMADYFLERVNDVIRVNGTARWHETLETEFGGMQEVLTNIHALTNEDKYLKLADLFVKPTFYDPLVAGTDVLEGRHANTHMAQVNGFAARHEHVGDQASLAAVSHFFKHLTSAHSYASGGSNDNEFWGAPSSLGDTFQKDKGINTQESCTTYNALKTARSLFRWSGASQFADFYERAVTNGVLGIARMPQQQTVHAPTTVCQAGSARKATDPRLAGLHSRRHSGAKSASRNDTDAPGPGVYLYHMPMGRSGVAKADNFHGWGHRFTSFWCCYGTAVESLSKLADSIFFWRHNIDELPALYVNQLQPSMLQWEALGLNITLRSSLFGDNGVAAMSLHFAVGDAAASFASGSKSVTINLKIRIPEWTDADAAQLSLDGSPIKCLFAAGDAKGYCSIVRSFKTGQRLDVQLPMQPRLETLQDDRPVFQAFKSLLIGPHLYAGLTHGPRDIVADPADVASMVSPVSSEGHLSLLPAWAPQGVFLRHDDGGLYASWLEDGGDALDATFRLVPGLSETPDHGSQQEALSLDVLQQWLQRHDAPPPAELVSLEMVGSPGAFLGLVHPGFWTAGDVQAEAVVTSHPEGTEARERHTFVLRCGLTGRAGGLSLESAEAPGSFLATHVPIDQHPSCNGVSASSCAKGRTSCAATCSRWEPRFKRLRVARAPAQGSNAAAAFAAAATFNVIEPQGHLPEGSKLLRSEQQSFIISPLSSIVDERYTAYFEWVNPHVQASSWLTQGWLALLWTCFRFYMAFAVVLAVVIHSAEFVHKKTRQQRSRRQCRSASTAAKSPSSAAPQQPRQPEQQPAVTVPSQALDAAESVPPQQPPQQLPQQPAATAESQAPDADEPPDGQAEPQLTLSGDAIALLELLKRIKPVAAAKAAAEATMAAKSPQLAAVMAQSLAQAASALFSQLAASGVADSGAGADSQAAAALRGRLAYEAVTAAAALAANSEAAAAAETQVIVKEWAAALRDQLEDSVAEGAANRLEGEFEWAVRTNELHITPSHGSHPGKQVASQSAGDAAAALHVLLDRAKSVVALKTQAATAAQPAAAKGQSLAEAAAALCKQLAAASARDDLDAIAASLAKLADDEAVVAASVAHLADARAAAEAEEKAVVAEWADALRTQLVDTVAEGTAAALLSHFESAVRNSGPCVTEPQDAVVNEQLAAAPLPAPQQDDAAPGKPSGKELDTAWQSAMQDPASATASETVRSCIRSCVHSRSDDPVAALLQSLQAATPQFVADPDIPSGSQEVSLMPTLQLSNLDANAHAGNQEAALLLETQSKPEMEAPAGEQQPVQPATTSTSTSVATASSDDEEGFAIINRVA